MSLTEALDQATRPGLQRLLAPLLMGQQRRLLQLETTLPSATFVVERATWRENVNGFAADASPPAGFDPLMAAVDCLSTNAHLELKRVIGEQMTLRLMTATGAYRTWHGYVAQAAQLGSDGGLSRYRLQLVAFTHFLTLREDTRVFLGQRADDIVARVLSAYPQANFRFELSPDTLSASPVRGTTTQYRETDAAFVARLLGEAGWNWRLEHLTDDAASSHAKSAKHVLVIGDATAPCTDLGPLRFGRTDIRRTGIGEDTVTSIAIARQVQPNAVTEGAWDAPQRAGVSAQTRTALRHGDLPTLEVYDGRGERRFAQHEHGDDLAHTATADAQAALQLARHELGFKTLHGESAVRQLETGAVFTLTEHSRYGWQGAARSARTDNAFRVLAIEHVAANNLGSEAAQILRATDIEAGAYRNRFIASPAVARLVPSARRKPVAPGVQTALVVGHEGEPLTTDRNLRVRMQFAWQRGTHPLPGGSRGPESPVGPTTGHAPHDASSSQWVRVAQPQAGANWGAVFIPRVGTEVLVDFIEGDLDRPVVVGQLHNGRDAMPWPAGVDSGANHPGTLSGWHSQTLDGAGFNQWVIDDATGQCRMRLASYSPYSPWSELTLGHLIAQAAAHSQRGAWLGGGFLAHTTGWASVRAAEGLLLSTTARKGTHGSAEGTQMDVAEAVSQLKAAHDLGQRLSDVAATQGAHALDSHAAQPGAAMQALLQAIDPRQKGQYTDHKKQHQREDTDPVERFDQPHIVFDTPSAAIVASAGPIASFAGQDISLTAQHDLHVCAAHTVSTVAGQTASLYTHQGDLQAIAANGNLSLRAHTDALEILADREVTVVSVDDEIRITANQRIELTAGDSQLVLNGGDIEFVTPGAFTVKAAGHAWAEGEAGTATLPALPSGLAGQPTRELELRYRYTDMSPVVGADYRVQFADGSVTTGRLDTNGESRIQNPPGNGQVFFGFDSRPAFQRKPREANGLLGISADTPQAAQAALDRYLAAEDEFLRDNLFPDEVPDGEQATAYEDQLDDYRYADELEVHEDGEAPGTHDEHLLTDDEKKEKTA
jgi:type VI secretion system secreted protein VgrG